MKSKFKLITFLFISILLIVLLVTLHYTHFDWKTLRYHSDQEYIEAAEKFARENLPCFPKSDQEKELVKYWVRVALETQWEEEVFGVLAVGDYVPKEALSRGKYVRISINKLWLLDSHRCNILHKNNGSGIEIYVSDDLLKQIPIYGRNFPGFDKNLGA